MVEQETLNLHVGGSNPSPTTTFFVWIKDAPWDGQLIEATTRNKAKYLYWVKVKDVWPRTAFTRVRIRRSK